MDICDLAPMSADETELLRIFEVHGADGRAISLESLRVNLPWGLHRIRLSSAIDSLRVRGVVRGGEEGLQPRGATAFRLIVATPRRPAPLEALGLNSPA